MELIFIVGGSLSFFFFLLLIIKKFKGLDDRILSIWFLLAAIYLTPFYFVYQNGTFRHISLVIFLQPITLLAGPIFYAYYEIISTNKKISWKHSLHLIPFIINCIELPFFLFNSHSLTLEYYAGFWFTKYEMIMRLISGPVYFSIILIKTYRLQQRIEFRSNEIVLSLKWIRNLSLGVFVVYLITLVVTVLELMFRIDIHFRYDYYTLTALTILIFYMGIMGSKQRNIFSNESISDNLNKAVKNKRTIYLKYNNMDKYEKQLYILMDKEKVFIDPLISLSSLAEKMEIPCHILSLLLNEKINKKFNDFINEYRIEEFKKLISLPSNKKYNIMALAYDAGFNSKATFNRIFKTYTGITPAEFKMSQNY